MKKVLIIIGIIAICISLVGCTTFNLPFGGGSSTPKVTTTPPASSLPLITRIQTLEAQQNSLNLQITALQSQVADLRSKVLADQQAISDLQNRLHPTTTQTTSP